MSTVLAPATNQLCFPWMQAESAATKRSSARARSRGPIPRPNPGKAVVVGTGISVADPIVRQSRTQVDAAKGAAVPSAEQCTAVQRPTISLQDGMRVGEVRIGAVMFGLLKKYGITDDEIAQVLAMIAQEQCAAAAG